MNSLKKIEKFFDYYIKRITEYPLKELKDQISNETHNQLIPPCVYQTWENKFFGKTHYQEILKFRDVNKDLSFILYDKTARDEYMEKYWSSHEIHHVYKNVKFGVMESDIFRHCILYERGGYYFDISKGCGVSIKSLHEKDTEAFLSNEPVECIIPPSEKIFPLLKFPHNNFLTWGLGFKKNHLIPKMMIENIVNDYKFYENKIFTKPKTAVLSLTATGQFTKVVRSYFENYDCDNIVQSGIYFDNKGIFSMKGCRVRHHLVQSYADIRNEKVI